MRIAITFLLTALLLTTILLNGCYERESMSIEYSKPTPAEWSRFQQLHIVFGHQSVGNNLLAGVRALAQEQQIEIAIGDRPDSGDNVVIRQFPIGENGNPDSKLEAFRTALAQGAGSYADVAEMKFCFIDFPPNVDPKALAANYIQQTATLSAQYPHIAFVTTTAPLTTIQTGPKAWLKRLFGKQPAGYEENLRRHAFNEALRTHYGSSPTLFDLAAIESLHGAISFTMNNQTAEALAPAITDDGGHLNELGQRLLASAWIRHLSQLKLPDHEKTTSAAQP